MIDLQHGDCLELMKDIEDKSIEWYNTKRKNVVINATNSLQYCENELYFSEQSAQDQDFLDKITPLWLKWKGII